MSDMRRLLNQWQENEDWSATIVRMRYSTNCGAGDVGGYQSRIYRWGDEPQRISHEDRDQPVRRPWRPGDQERRQGRAHPPSCASVERLNDDRSLVADQPGSVHFMEGEVVVEQPLSDPHSDRRGGQTVRDVLDGQDGLVSGCAT
jgi:hypothetical protein